jgi:hypothetical protein
MAIAAISSAPTPPPPTTGSLARVADGDYKSANARSAPTKDGDGDYKSLARSTAAQSTASVQASLTSLKAGG